MKVASRAAALASAVTAGLLAPAAPAYATTDVFPGQSIQVAVDAAPPGATIFVHAGVYHESVLITKSLTLEGAGDGTVLLPPTSPAATHCVFDGGVSGLCAFGQFDEQFHLIKPVSNVHISGFLIRDFGLFGLIGLGTDGLQVTKVEADNDGEYGIVNFVSTHTVYAHNRASGNGEAGLYIGDSPGASGLVAHNEATNNGIGIFLRDSTGIAAENNTTAGNCAGIVALNTGHGATAGGAYRIHDNVVRANNRACPPSEEGPPISGIGIALAGVHDVVVEHNTVIENRPTGPSLASGGVVVVSTAPMGGADPTGNAVHGNVILNNNAADIVWDGTGSGNSFTGNVCRTSLPPGLC